MAGAADCLRRTQTRPARSCAIHRASFSRHGRPRTRTIVSRTQTRVRSPKSAGGSMACRLRSSWCPHDWQSAVPTGVLDELDDRFRTLRRQNPGSPLRQRDPPSDARMELRVAHTGRGNRPPCGARFSPELSMRAGWALSFVVGGFLQSIRDPSLTDCVPSRC